MSKGSRLLVALILSCYSLAPLGAGAKSDRERAGLSGPVRTVTTTATLPGTKRSPGQHSVTTYDPQGNELEAAVYNYGVLTEKEVHTCGTQGQRTEIAQYSSDGTLFAKTTYLRTSAPQGQRIEQRGGNK